MRNLMKELGLDDPRKLEEARLAFKTNPQLQTFTKQMPELAALTNDPAKWAATFGGSGSTPPPQAKAKAAAAATKETGKKDPLQEMRNLMKELGLDDPSKLEEARLAFKTNPQLQTFTKQMPELAALTN